MGDQASGDGDLGRAPGPDRNSTSAVTVMLVAIIAGLLVAVVALGAFALGKRTSETSAPPTSSTTTSSTSAPPTTAPTTTSALPEVTLPTATAAPERSSGSVRSSPPSPAAPAGGSSSAGASIGSADDFSTPSTVGIESATLEAVTGVAWDKQMLYTLGAAYCNDWDSIEDPSGIGSVISPLGEEQWANYAASSVGLTPQQALAAIRTGIPYQYRNCE